MFFPSRGCRILFITWIYAKNMVNLNICNHCMFGLYKPIHAYHCKRLGFKSRCVSIHKWHEMGKKTTHVCLWCVQQCNMYFSYTIRSKITSCILPHRKSSSFFNLTNFNSLSVGNKSLFHFGFILFNPKSGTSILYQWVIRVYLGNLYLLGKR